MTEIKPYGDWTDDGKVQLSFTLPIVEGVRARRAALALAEKMGFNRPMVVHMKGMGEYTFFVLYGETTHTVDPDVLEVGNRGFPLMSPEKVNLLIREKLKRQLVVAGACTGTDAHTVGLDAILSMKGFAGDKGLEYYHEMRILNLGSQVAPEAIADVVRDEGVDAVLISQVVTQRDAHIHHLKEVREVLEIAGLREQVILVGGGPRFSPEQAPELGYDHVFGRGSKPSEVASYLAWEATRRMEEAA
jgi:beta-lysine 5,6-aminomutase beta subunit